MHFFVVIVAACVSFRLEKQRKYCGKKLEIQTILIITHEALPIFFSHRVQRRRIMQESLRRNVRREERGGRGDGGRCARWPLDGSDRGPHRHGGSPDVVRHR